MNKAITVCRTVYIPLIVASPPPPKKGYMKCNKFDNTVGGIVIDFKWLQLLSENSYSGFVVLRMKSEFEVVWCMFSEICIHREWNLINIHILLVLRENEFHKEAACVYYMSA